MKNRIGMVLVAVLSGLLTAIMVTPASAASAHRAFVAKPGVITVTNGISPAGGATVAVTPPQSFCYVGVNQPTLSADRKLTETWWLDCRSLANPQLPAPDIQSVHMQVRIYNGTPNPYLPGVMVGGTECYRYGTKPSCSATTYSPIKTGAPYYTRLDVAVALTGGTTQYGSFVTDPITFT